MVLQNSEQLGRLGNKIIIQNLMSYTLYDHKHYYFQPAQLHCTTSLRVILDHTLHMHVC